MTTIKAGKSINFHLVQSFSHLFADGLNLRQSQSLFSRLQRCIRHGRRRPKLRRLDGALLVGRHLPVGGGGRYEPWHSHFNAALSGRPSENFENESVALRADQIENVELGHGNDVVFVDEDYVVAWQYSALLSRQVRLDLFDTRRMRPHDGKAEAILRRFDKLLRYRERRAAIALSQRRLTRLSVSRRRLQLEEAQKKVLIGIALMLSLLAECYITIVVPIATLITSCTIVRFYNFVDARVGISKHFSQHIRNT